MSDPPAGRLDLRLVPAAVTAWVVTAAAIGGRAGPVLAAACAVTGLAWWVTARRGAAKAVLRRGAAGVTAAAAVGAGFAVAGMLRSDAVDQHPISGRFGTSAAVTVAATASPRPAGGGRMLFPADLIRVGGQPAGGRVVVFGGSGFGPVTAGQPVSFTARISRPTRRDLTVAVLRASGTPELGAAPVVARAAGAVRTGFAATARRVLPAGQAAILPGLVLGDTSAVDPGTVADFRTAGLTHLTAVSGANVTIVCGSVLLAAGLLGPRVAVLLAGVTLAAFVVVVQPEASVLRAAVMGAIALLGVLCARRRQAVPALAATVLTLLALAPHLAVDVGFALSVSATAALVLLAPAWSARLVGRGWPKAAADAVCVALAAQLVTAPLVAAISGRLSLVAVVANLAVAPVIPVITVLGTAAAALSPVWPAGADLLVRFTGPPLWWLLVVAARSAGVPGAAITVPSGWAGLALVGGVAVAGVLGRRRRWCRAAAAAAALCGAAWSVSALVGGP